jgi:hypothetical protein
LPISDWADQGYEERAAQLLEWHLAYRGPRWYPGSFPSEQELAAWLLAEEGSVFRDDPLAFDIMARATRYRLGGGINARILAGYTSYINPVFGNGGRYGPEDWQAFVGASRATLKVYLDKMKVVYALTGDFVYRGPGSEPVIYWWDDTEDTVLDANASYYHRTLVTVGWDNEGNPISRPFYFGTCSQAAASGFSGAAGCR